MYYTVYKTTNQVNGKFYIGSHKTKNPNDAYLGSGKYLKHAIEKYGRDNFVKEVLFVFDNPTEMYAKEAELVNIDFIAESNTYNLKQGGFGGFDYINEHKLQNTEARRVFLRTVHQPLLNQLRLKKYYNNPSFREQVVGHLRKMTTKRMMLHPEGNFKGKQHTDASKAKMREKAKVNSAGERNSQFGTVWMYSPDSELALKIPKCDIDLYVQNGWIRGRKAK